MSESIINVVPNLSNQHQRKVQFDPDVVEIKEKVNVVDMKHEETEEEKKEEKQPINTKYIVITLAVIVVVLICVIVWYVLKKNKDSDMMPKFFQTQFRNPAPPVRPAVPPHYAHIVRPTQTLSPEPQAKPRPVAAAKIEEIETPSKEELENELKSLSTITEETKEEVDKENDEEPDSVGEQFEDTLLQTAELDDEEEVN